MIRRQRNRHYETPTLVGVSLFWYLPALGTHFYGDSKQKTKNFTETLAISHERTRFEVQRRQRYKTHFTESSQVALHLAHHPNHTELWLLFSLLLLRFGSMRSNTSVGRDVILWHVRFAGVADCLDWLPKTRSRSTYSRIRTRSSYQFSWYSCDTTAQRIQ